MKQARSPPWPGLPKQRKTVLAVRSVELNVLGVIFVEICFDHWIRILSQNQKANEKHIELVRWIRESSSQLALAYPRVSKSKEWPSENPRMYLTIPSLDPGDIFHVPWLLNRHVCYLLVLKQSRTVSNEYNKMVLKLRYYPAIPRIYIRVVLYWESYDRTVASPGRNM